MGGSRGPGREPGPRESSPPAAGFFGGHSGVRARCPGPRIISGARSCARPAGRPGAPRRRLAARRDGANRGYSFAVFGIGMTELMVIFVIALLVLGPKRLPGLARSLGKGLAEFRRASTDMRREFLDVAEEVRIDPRSLTAEPEPEPEPAADDETAAKPAPAADAEPAGKRGDD